MRSPREIKKPSIVRGFIFDLFNKIVYDIYMNTIKKSDSGTEEEKGIVGSSVHHPVPRTTNDSVDVILSAEGGEKEPNSLSEMTCVYFDDLPVQRLMVGKFMEKV